MSDRAQQTEKPTPRRIEKAREQGRYAVSREALSAVTFAVAAILIVRFLPDWIEQFSRLTRFLIARAFSERFSLRTALAIWQTILISNFLPMLAAGSMVLVAGVGMQLAMTGFGFAGSRLTLDWNRLNPVPKLRDLPSQNATQVLQSIVVLAVFALLVATQIDEWLATALTLPLQPLGAAISSISGTLTSLLYKAILVFLILGAVDYIRQRMRYYRDLRMTKQEIREEMKESEGNPQIKQKIRRLQRDAARRRMMEQVPKATAVVVNPTHYSVAIFYDMSGMAAPRVVAKGKNYLARRIREIAIANEVPIVENPPLARSLYKSVEVGREIPASLYRAVAEVLAYIYRLMQAGRR